MTVHPLRTNDVAPRLLDAASALGFAAVLACDSGRGTLGVASLVAWLDTPLRLGQAVVHVEHGRVLGLATWAYVSPAVFKRLATGGRDLLALEEWNEGTIPWIVDFMSPYGRAVATARALRDRLAADRGFAFHRRRGRLRRVVAAA